MSKKREEISSFLSIVELMSSQRYPSQIEPVPSGFHEKHSELIYKTQEPNEVQSFYLYAFPMCSFFSLISSGNFLLTLKEVEITMVTLREKLLKQLMLEFKNIKEHPLSFGWQTQLRLILGSLHSPPLPA